MSTVEPGYLRKHIPCEEYREYDNFFWDIDQLSAYLVSPPGEGEDFQVIADDYQKYIMPGKFDDREVTQFLTPPLIGLTHWQHPSFFAYFPTACTFEGILGDLYASSTANPGFNVCVLPRRFLSFLKHSAVVE